MKVLNQLLAGKRVHFLGIELDFDENGHVHVSDEHALELANIPGYEIVNEELTNAVDKAAGLGKKGSKKKPALPEGPVVNGKLVEAPVAPEVPEAPVAPEVPAAVEGGAAPEVTQPEVTAPDAGQE